MSRLLIVEPLLAGVLTSRGTGSGNLMTDDPKEVWADTMSGSDAQIVLDLGRAVAIDTLCLAHVRPPAMGAVWQITGGVTTGAEFFIQTPVALRVPDVEGGFAQATFALWTGAPVTVRYVAITLSQPAGAPPLTIGRAVIGHAFVTELGQEWGAGRRVIDTGVATPLPSGGFAIVEGVRKASYGWTFGDLSQDEADRLEQIALRIGETRAALVVEDDQRSTGLQARIRYGKFDRWKAFERRNRRQTRWELGIEDWV